MSKILRQICKRYFSYMLSLQLILQPFLLPTIVFSQTLTDVVSTVSQVGQIGQFIANQQALQSAIIQSQTEQLINQVVPQQEAFVNQTAKALVNEVNNVSACLQRSNESLSMAASVYSSIPTASVTDAPDLTPDACKEKVVKNTSILGDSVEVNCATSEEIIKTGKKQIDWIGCRTKQIIKLRNAVNCLKGFSSKMERFAGGIQSAITQVDKELRKILEKEDRTIQQYQIAIREIRKVVDGQVDQEGNPVGRAGIRGQLANIEGLYKALDKSLEEPAPGVGQIGTISAGDSDTGLQRGIRRRYENFEIESKNLANAWYQQLINERQRCFDTVNDACTTGVADQTASPFACITGSVLIDTTRDREQQSNIGGRTQRNARTMSRIIDFYTKQIDEKKTVSIGISHYDTKELINQFTQESQRNITYWNRAVNKYRKDFQGINPARKRKLKKIFEQKYSSCYKNAAKKFQAFLQTGATAGNPFGQQAKAFNDQERQLRVDINEWIDRLTTSITRFNRDFTRVYNPLQDLFATRCRSAEKNFGSSREAMKTSMKCLEQLRDDVGESLNGNKFQTQVAMPNPNNLQKPTTITCINLNDCLAKFDQATESYQTAITNVQEKRSNFAVDQRKRLKDLKDNIGTQIRVALGETGLGRLVTGMNQMLASFNINGELIMKAPEPPAAFELDDRDPATGQLYKPPASPNELLRILGKDGYYQELTEDSQKSVAKSIAEDIEQKRKDILEINKKMKEATFKKRECRITYTDLKGITSGLKCDSKLVCSDNALRKVLVQMERVGDKAQTNYKETRRGKRGNRRDRSEVSQCLKDLKNEKTDFSQLQILALSKGSEGVDQAQQLLLQQQLRNENESKIDKKFNCMELGLSTAADLFSNTRKGLKLRLLEIADSMGDLLDSCKAHKDTEDELVRSLSSDIASKTKSAESSTKACLDQLPPLRNSYLKKHGDLKTSFSNYSGDAEDRLLIEKALDTMQKARDKYQRSALIGEADLSGIKDLARRFISGNIFKKATNPRARSRESLPKGTQDRWAKILVSINQSQESNESTDKALKDLEAAHNKEKTSLRNDFRTDKSKILANTTSTQAERDEAIARLKAELDDDITAMNKQYEKDKKQIEDIGKNKKTPRYVQNLINGIENDLIEIANQIDNCEALNNAKNDTIETLKRNVASGLEADMGDAKNACEDLRQIVDDLADRAKRKTSGFSEDEESGAD